MEKYRIFSCVFVIANQLLTRHSPFAHLGRVDEWKVKPSPFSIQGRFVCKGLFCLFDKKKIIIIINGCLQIWNFSSRVQLHIFLVRCTHSWAVECNSASTRAHVLFAMWFLTNFFHCRSYAANFWFYFFLFLFLSCWISSANNLIWMFVTFVISIEVVSFWFGLFISVILI